MVINILVYPNSGCELLELELGSANVVSWLVYMCWHGCEHKHESTQNQVLCNLPLWDTCTHFHAQCNTREEKRRPTWVYSSFVNISTFSVKSLATSRSNNWLRARWAFERVEPSRWPSSLVEALRDEPMLPELSECRWVRGGPGARSCCTSFSIPSTCRFQHVWDNWW